MTYTDMKDIDRQKMYKQLKTPRGVTGLGCLVTVLFICYFIFAFIFFLTAVETAGH